MINEQIRGILNEVCKKYGVTRPELSGASKMSWYVRARDEAIWRLRNEMRLSAPHIAAIMKRNHSTIIHALEKLRKEHEGGDLPQNNP